MLTRRTPCCLAAVALLVIAGCQDDPTGPSASITGHWGAEHIVLDADAAAAVLEYDCAHGTIDQPLDLDDGRFDLVGTHTFESGGPVGEDDVPDVHPARYQGRVVGSLLTLTITLTDDGRVLGPYLLVRGAPGVLYRCL